MKKLLNILDYIYVSYLKNKTVHQKKNAEKYVKSVFKSHA